MGAFTGESWNCIPMSPNPSVLTCASPPVSTLDEVNAVQYPSGRTVFKDGAAPEAGAMTRKLSTRVVAVVAAIGLCASVFVALPALSQPAGGQTNEVVTK